MNDKEQILIVDDDPVMSRLLDIILSEKYATIKKMNGIDAFRWLEEGNHPSLIISDMMMPYLDGSSFVKNLKISGFYRDTPVIVLSGAENLDELIEQMPFKVDGYFPKPFNPVILKDTIATILDAKHKTATS